MKDAGGREDNKNLFIAWYLNFVAIIVIVLFLYDNNYSYKYIIISIYILLGLELVVISGSIGL